MGKRLCGSVDLDKVITCKPLANSKSGLPVSCVALKVILLDAAGAASAAV